MRSLPAWAGLLLFIIVGAALYVLRADAIALLIYLLAFAVILTVKSRGGLQNFGLTAATILALLLIATVITTLFEPHLIPTITKLDKPDGKFFAERPILGWGPAAAGRYRAMHVLNHKLVYDVIYTIDHDLLRKTDSGRDGKGITFLGDSYIFGEGLEDNETLPQQFADLEGRKAPVYNLGFSAYSPSQALAEMRAGIYDKQLINSRLIVEFATSWESERMTCKASFVEGAPRFVQRDGKILQDGVCPQFRPSPLTYFSIFRFIQSKISIVRDSDISIFTAVTQEVIRLAREKYKVPIVIYYLRAPQYLRRLHDWNDDKIMQSLRASGATVLEYDLPSSPRYSIQGDGHPTGLANAYSARRLFDFLHEKFPNIEPVSLPAPVH